MDDEMDDEIGDESRRQLRIRRAEQRRSVHRRRGG